MAGLVIFPIVFASRLQPSEGPGLLFVSLPAAFGTCCWVVLRCPVFHPGDAGRLELGHFLLEPGVAWLIESKGMSRVTANLSLGLIAWVLGLNALSFKPGRTAAGFNFLNS